MTDMDRDDDFTREVVQQAAKRKGVNPHSILTMSAARTLPGPIRAGWQRDLTHEAHEELADAINYIPWEIRKQQDLAAPGLPIAQHHYLEALGACVYAFEQLTIAREALHEGCNRCGGQLEPAEGEFIPMLVCRRCGREIPR
jgi:hypothetical protein